MLSAITKSVQHADCLVKLVQCSRDIVDRHKQHVCFDPDRSCGGHVGWVRSQPVVVGADEPPVCFLCFPAISLVEFGCICGRPVSVGTQQRSECFYCKDNNKQLHPMA